MYLVILNRLFVNSKTMMIVGLVTTAPILFASPEDEVVAEYLRQHNMITLLEAQLEGRIEDAGNQDERVELSEQLSKLYLDQLKSIAKDDPYRQIVINRASELANRMKSMPMFDLRIELLIEQYLAVEQSVELSRLSLLDFGSRQSALNSLQEMSPKLKSLTSQLDFEVEQSERVRSRDNTDDDEQLSELRRYRSLSHYYSAWVGYSIATLKEQHVPNDVFVSFGWLLGAKGEMPQVALLNETTLFYDHVARSAIGVALAYAQSDDLLSARAWAKLVVQSEYTEPESKKIADNRLLQIMSLDRDWIAVNRWVDSAVRSSDEELILNVSDARFVALRSLEAISSSRVGQGGAKEAKQAARFAIEQLVEAGEIGHVLDLYRQFKNLPLVGDSFITNYAQALVDLDQAEQDGASGLYSSVATKFARAMEATDAIKFKDELQDCQLKLIYCEIRGGRENEAVLICEQLINSSSDKVVIEEARWLRIAALDSVNRNRNKNRSDELDIATKEYISAYPSTSRSAQLIIRYAMQGSLNPQVAIDTLESVALDDPFALPARRTLIGIRYKALRVDQFKDQEQINQVLNIVQWVMESQSDSPGDVSEARMMMETIRIGLDLSLRLDSPNLQLANQLLNQADELMKFSSEFEVYRSELLYRQVEISALNGRFNDASKLIDQLLKIDQSRAHNARVLLFNLDIQSWKSNKNAQIAMRLMSNGSGIFSQISPPNPQPIGGQLSSVAELIVEAALFLWEVEKDIDAKRLAFRVAKIVLDRGNPTESGLRKTVLLAHDVGEQEIELEAWLRLLASYGTEDQLWYEARFESLKVMLSIDRQRAITAYEQYRILHPTLGPAPWDEKFRLLFGNQLSPSTPSDDGGFP
ncbi:MAG: hypothetical protein P1U42_01790 [Phycisphaerales bacterium]|nr:hypothetical protein [Phycisphaerales bacterium]